MTRFGHPEDYLRYRGWEVEDRSGADDYLPDFLYHRAVTNPSHHNLRYEDALITQLLEDVSAIGGLEALMAQADGDDKGSA